MSFEIPISIIMSLKSVIGELHEKETDVALELPRISSKYCLCWLIFGDSELPFAMDECYILTSEITCKPIGMRES